MNANYDSFLRNSIEVFKTFSDAFIYTRNKYFINAHNALCGLS